MTVGNSLVEDMARAAYIEGLVAGVSSGYVNATIAEDAWAASRARETVSVLKDRLPADDRELVERLLNNARLTDDFCTKEVCTEAADRITAYSASRDEAEARVAELVQAIAGCSGSCGQALALPPKEQS